MIPLSLMREFSWGPEGLVSLGVIPLSAVSKNSREIGFPVNPYMGSAVYTDCAGGGRGRAHYILQVAVPCMGRSHLRSIPPKKKIKKIRDISSSLHGLLNWLPISLSSKIFGLSNWPNIGLLPDVCAQIPSYILNLHSSGLHHGNTMVKFAIANRTFEIHFEFPKDPE